MSSCSNKSENYVFKSAVFGNPKTLDPQCAFDASAYSVIHNVFQGLFTYNENGDIVYGMIDDYSVSEDGLLWLFELKEGIMWSDGADYQAECTANDYVFAFQRLFKPETMSERAGEYYIIKNSEKINKGIISDLSELGVRAINTYTLEIELEKTCSNFKALLAMSPAMPCNEEYFVSTEGRYGLAADCVASNHDYYVHTWNYDKWSNDNNYFILRLNKLNKNKKTIPMGINFFINPNNEYKDFEDGTFSVYNSKSAEETIELLNEYNYLTFEIGVWGFIFNFRSEFSEYDYRISLANCVDYGEKDLIYSEIKRIIPDNINIGEQSYSSISDVSAQYHNSDISNVGMLTSKKFIMPQNSGLRAKIGDILQTWQVECNFYCNLSELNDIDYLKALQNGDFDIALVRIDGEYNSPYAFLNNFLHDNYENYSNYKNQKFEHIINSALTANDDKIAASFYMEAEQLLVDNAIFVPLCTEKEFIFVSDKLDNVWYNPYSRVYGYMESD